MKPVGLRIIIVLSLLHCIACREEKKRGRPVDLGQLSQQSIKPGAGNHDTLNIERAAVVFFQPDSLQLQKIKSVTAEQVFESSMHEYAYQIRNGHIYLNENWPKLNIIDTRNARYLRFIKKDGTDIYIDLDTKDPAGMYLFDGIKDPKPADMMNIDTEIPVYFTKPVSEKNHVLK